MSAFLQVGGVHWLAADMPTQPDIVPASDPLLDPAQAEGCVRIVAVYTVHADGALTVVWDIDASDAMPAPLPLGLNR